MVFNDKSGTEKRTSFSIKKSRWILVWLIFFVDFSESCSHCSWICIVSFQVHAMLDFAEDLEECRKIQFAKFVLFSLSFFRWRCETDVCVFCFIFYFILKGIFHIRLIYLSHRGALKIRMLSSVVDIVIIVLVLRKPSNVKMSRFILGSCCRSRIISTRTAGRLQWTCWRAWHGIREELLMYHLVRRGDKKRRKRLPWFWMILLVALLICLGMWVMALDWSWLRLFTGNGN